MNTLVKDRIEHISRLIFEVANGNFDYRIDASETDDELEAIVLGVNMLGQELKKSTVSRDYMQGIYNGVIDMLIIMDSDLKIRTTNGAVSNLLGYSADELIGKEIGSILFEKGPDDQVIDTIKADLKEQGQSKNIEFIFESKAGVQIPTSSSFSLLRNSNKEVEGVMVIAKDITELKEKEKELRIAKENAEEANLAKGRFLSNMSHEIRTPLNGIIGFTELLRSTKTTETQSEYLTLIHTSGETLAKLLNDVLDLNKIDLDKLQLENLPFNFNEVISSNLNPYKYMANEKALKFNYTISENFPKVIKGDPTRINQVVVNLVSNAMKFTDKGNIDVIFKFQKERNREYLYCEVIDTGVGVPKDKHNLIFETFTQSDTSTTRKYGGSGLGLAICKQLVGLMNGEIGLESPVDENGGSKFWFRIPVEEVEAPKTSEKDSSKNDFKLQKPTNILVVDDNHVNLLLIKQVLAMVGASVTSAIHGREAVEKVSKENFDLIFMDIQMPVMDGFGATAELRRLGFDKPILALSANVDKDNIEKCHEVGMNDYLQKPFHKKQLIGLLEKWV